MAFPSKAFLLCPRVASLESAGLSKGMGMTRQLWVSRSCLKITSIHSCLPITTSRAFKSSFSIKSTKEELSQVICFILFLDVVASEGRDHTGPQAPMSSLMGLSKQLSMSTSCWVSGQDSCKEDHCATPATLVSRWDRNFDAPMSKAEDTESTPATKRGKASACTKSLKCWASLSLQQILAVLWWKKSSVYF